MKYAGKRESTGYYLHQDVHVRSFAYACCKYSCKHIAKPSAAEAQVLYACSLQDAVQIVCSAHICAPANLDTGVAQELADSENHQGHIRCCS